MKQLVALLFIIILIACEEGFEPFGPEKEVIILDCVLKNDNSFQSAFLSRNFFVESFDPSIDNSDYAIKDAIIRIWYDDSIKVFKDSLFSGVNNGGKMFTAYYNPNFETKPDTKYEIEAIFGDGRRIGAQTKTPKEIVFLTSSDSIIPTKNKNDISITWRYPEEQLYTAARFTFVYLKNEDGNMIRHTQEIPSEYVFEGDEYIPYFPEPSYSRGLTVDLKTFDRALKNISTGDPQKENYTILSFILEIFVYDRNLTSYHASRDQSYSITVNENDYTNIEGGVGIFGSYIKQKHSLKFTHDYVKSFGYKPGLTE